MFPVENFVRVILKRCYFTKFSIVYLAREKTTEEYSKNVNTCRKLYFDETGNFQVKLRLYFI